MKQIKQQSGFSAVELLITLTVAAAFLISGFQLYGVIVKSQGEVRRQAKASSLSNEYLNLYKENITSTCTASNPKTDEVINNVDGLSNVKLTVVISCPYSTTSTVSKVLVKIKYGNDSPQKEINNASFSTR